MATKVLDVISRLPGCAGHATRRSLRVHPRQEGGRSSIAPTSEVGLPHPFGFVHLGPGGEDGGTQFRQCFRWKGTPVGRSALVVTIRQSLDGKWMGENSMLGVVVCTPVNGNSFHPCTWKGRVVLRGDVVEDDSGSIVVFTEHGSSASQMMTAKVLDVIARRPGCAGQASDTGSAQTQVKIEDASTLLQVPESEWPDMWIRPWHEIEEPVVHLERNLPPPCWIVVGETVRIIFLGGNGRERKHHPGNACLCIISRVKFCPCTWMTRWLGRQRIWSPCGSN